MLIEQKKRGPKRNSITTTTVSSVTPRNKSTAKIGEASSSSSMHAQEPTSPSVESEDAMSEDEEEEEYEDDQGTEEAEDVEEEDYELQTTPQDTSDMDIVYINTPEVVDESSPPSNPNRDSFFGEGDDADNSSFFRELEAFGPIVMDTTLPSGDDGSRRDSLFSDEFNYDMLPNNLQLFDTVGSPAFPSSNTPMSGSTADYLSQILGTPSNLMNAAALNAIAPAEWICESMAPTNSIPTVPQPPLYPAAASHSTDIMGDRAMFPSIPTFPMKPDFAPRAATWKLSDLKSDDLQLPASLATGLPDDFHLHVITLYFTYFHPSYPIIDEPTFFKSLLSLRARSRLATGTPDDSSPRSMHPSIEGSKQDDASGKLGVFDGASEALLNAIYGIGTLYSAHPHVASVGGRIPLSERFIQVARRSLRIGSDAIARCLIDTCTFGCTVNTPSEMELLPGTWRIAQKQQLAFDSPYSSLYHVANGRQAPTDTQPAGKQAKKRAWWGIFSLDTFTALCTGYDFLVDEARYMGALLDTESLCRVATHTLAAEKAVQDSRYGLTFAPSGIQMWASPEQESSVVDTTPELVWDAAGLGSPRCTIFQFSSECTSGYSAAQQLSTPAESSADQLVTSLSDVQPHIRLSIFLRKIIRGTTQANQNTPAQVAALHGKLMRLSTSLPLDVRRYVAIGQPLTATDYVKHLSPTSVHTILLFLASLSVLHQMRLEDTSIMHDTTVLGATATGTSVNTSMTSLGVCCAVYTRAVALLDSIYAARFATSLNDGPTDNGTLSALSAPAPPYPPHELVALPFTPVLLALTAIPVLSSKHGQVLVNASVGHIGTAPSDLPCLERGILPALDDIAMVWPRASCYAATLRSWAEVVREPVAVKKTKVADTASLLWKKWDGSSMQRINVAFDI
ncbi:uncharacterized protein EV422DRAFT_517462 [Fimicolochytrium jonesii]|uniref:uncharacterized protein n=1 Tax=Fimicolochytrium jonesii TaxID=1396493 RepID=UPI0022FDE44E|nr:uncharacterized protein EV422DRAFT_517462 [Fimicolochytrium jonesii]KAI8825106.1 hypothetical protein EV422DRAFT_517462 [Fimicolochytrium jonesii]